MERSSAPKHTHIVDRSIGALCKESPCHGYGITTSRTSCSLQTRVSRELRLFHHTFLSTFLQDLSISIIFTFTSKSFQLSIILKLSVKMVSKLFAENSGRPVTSSRHIQFGIQVLVNCWNPRGRQLFAFHYSPYNPQ